MGDGPVRDVIVAGGVSEEPLLALFDSAVLGGALTGLGTSGPEFAREEIEILVGLIRNTEAKPLIRLAAMRYFDEKALRALKLSGRVATVTASQRSTDSDITTERSLTAAVIARDKTLSNLKLLGKDIDAEERQSGEAKSAEDESTPLRDVP